MTPPFDTLVAIAACLLILGGAFVFARRASRRFEAEQRRLGRWDEHGPLHPTDAPRHERFSRRSIGLNLGPTTPGPTRASRPPGAPTAREAKRAARLAAKRKRRGDAA